MNSYAQLYWLTRLDYLQGCFIALAIVSGIGIIAYHIYGACMADVNCWDESEKREYRRKYKWKVNVAGILLPFSVLIACMIPTRNEALVIMAGGSVMEYAKKDTSLQKLPYQATEIISQMMDEKIKELKEK